MIQLPNNCRCSEPSVFPANWNKVSASLKKNWHIQYYFYDPVHCPSGKLKMLKAGINRLKTLAERRDAVNRAMRGLLYNLKEEGYNPITDTKTPPVAAYEIEPTTRWMEALQLVYAKMKLEKSTSSDVKCCLKAVTTAASSIGLAALAVGEVKRKHIKALLAQVGEVKPLSGHRFNKFRSYLMMLFKELVEMEAIDSNPVLEISKQKTVHKIRDTLTPEQRLQVDEHLKNNLPEFWRFLHIFFHSGAREIELLRVQVKDVDLARQKFRATIKKGKQAKEVDRTIKNSVLHLWQELLEGAKPDDYIFSKGLVPGSQTIRREQITRRWKTHVKDKLGVSADFYSLKHEHTTQVVDLLSDEAAAKHNGHTSTAMVNNVYDIKSKKRKQDLLQNLDNKFA